MRRNCHLLFAPNECTPQCTNFESIKKGLLARRCRTAVGYFLYQREEARLKLLRRYSLAVPPRECFFLFPRRTYLIRHTDGFNLLFHPRLFTVGGIATAPQRRWTTILFALLPLSLLVAISSTRLLPPPLWCGLMSRIIRRLQRLKK